MNPGAPRVHYRWERTEESEDFFIDEDRLRACFYVLASGAGALLLALAVGLWRLHAAAIAPPLMVGVAQGMVFSSRPAPLATLKAGDFDAQFSDTVEVLFSRTEKGLPPEVRQFCAPEVVAAVDRSYRDAAAQYPAGFVQTLGLLEAKPAETRPGLRRILYRGLLSSRSVAAAQISPLYLDCTFAMAGASPLNASGWRLVRVVWIGPDEFYRGEREKAAKEELGLP
jgi:hypothetical protein